MGFDIFASGSSSIDRLIETTLQIESIPRFRLEDRKAALNVRKKVLSDLDSKLSALTSLAKKYTDVLTDYFAAKTASSSDSALFSATAESSALVGNHDVFVERLAISDTRVSQQYSATGTELRTFFDTNGSQTFQISVGHPTDSDSSNRETISVTVNPTGATNDDIMNEIALAVNNAMSSAVTADTIDADEKLSASVVHEEDGKSRMIFKSSKSGFTYRMVMTDSGNSLLSTLDINSTAQSSGTAGGYITSVGTSASDSLLNAKLQVNGLTFYRDSNAIGDILDGVTMTLKGVTQTTENMKVEVDVKSVKEGLQELLDAYNSVINFLKENSRVDPDTKVRGALAGDSTYSFLRSKLRGILTGKVSGIDAGNPEHLFEIGITAASDGTLSFTDTEKFENALAEGSTKVSDLFNSTNGIANDLKDLLGNYVKVGGIISDSTNSMADKIKSMDKRIERFDDRLAKRELQLRTEFARMQQIATLLGGQSAAFASLTSSFRF